MELFYEEFANQPPQPTNDPLAIFFHNQMVERAAFGQWYTSLTGENKKMGTELGNLQR